MFILFIYLFIVYTLYTVCVCVCVGSTCEARLFSSINGEGTQYGPFGVGNYNNYLNFQNDGIHSVNLSSSGGYCTIRLYAAGNNDPNGENDWEEYCINPGETRIIDTNTLPNNYFNSPNGESVWTWDSTLSYISSLSSFSLTKTNECNKRM